MLGKTNVKPAPKYYSRVVDGRALGMGLGASGAKQTILTDMQPGTYVAQFLFDTESGNQALYNYSTVNGVGSPGWQQIGKAVCAWPISTFTVTPAQAAAGVTVFFQLGYDGAPGYITYALCFIRRIG